MSWGNLKVFDSLEFQGKWRSYQARVLGELDGHFEDDRLHIVAAPGSGKTILGLEVIRRLGKRTLVLAPTLTIQAQWKSRLDGLFLPPDASVDDDVSFEMRSPKTLTLSTYQALHTCFREQESGYLKDHDDDLLELLTDTEVIVLDEAHHLRREWWNALKQTIERRKTSKGSKLQIVSLTATPPYDVEANEWDRYDELCGPIDVEISIPELVDQGDLAPHQDYVYLTPPHSSEAPSVSIFGEARIEYVTQLLANTDLQDAILKHPWIAYTSRLEDEILTTPALFSSILVYLNAAGLKPPEGCLKLLEQQQEHLPNLTYEWVDTLLNGILFQQAGLFPDVVAVLEADHRELKRIGALQRRKVCLSQIHPNSKQISQSISKLASVADIISAEHKSLGKGLRAVVLSDFIRKSDLPRSGDDIKPVLSLGVVPIFETLRRQEIARDTLAVLTGSLVILPTHCLKPLENILSGLPRPGPLPGDGSYSVLQVNDTFRQNIVEAITRLFEDGHFNVLIGTQALLGEGWDAPSINTLILASTVGSFMLSNQMRGRAIRRDPDAPEKVANIWHLATVLPPMMPPWLRQTMLGSLDIDNPEDSDKLTTYYGPDLPTLVRRFRMFEGPNINGDVIENGISRLELQPHQWSSTTIQDINVQTLDRAKNRSAITDHWRSAIKGNSPNPELRHDLNAKMVPLIFITDKTLRALISFGLTLIAVGLHQAMQGFELERSSVYSFLLPLLFAGAGAWNIVRATWAYLRTGTIERSLSSLSEAVLNAACAANAIKSPRRRLNAISHLDKHGTAFVRLLGGTSADRRIFYRMLGELLGPIDNPRYLLIRRSRIGWIKRIDYHAVPKALGGQKKWAERLRSEWRDHVGDAELVYTRSSAGRRTLLRGRAFSMASRIERKTYEKTKWE